MRYLILLLLLLAPRFTQALDFPFSTQGFGEAPYSRMYTILEKTFLDVDVLRLEIYFSKETARSLELILAAKENSPNVDQRLADTAGHAEEAVAKIQFLRSVSLAQFLQGIQDNLVLAKNAGYISNADYANISQGLPKWYAFLKERGIHNGDLMYYQIHHNTLRVIYKSADDGQILLDQTDVGPERRLSVLGSYFAAGSDFREGLLRSLVK